MLPEEANRIADHQRRRFNELVDVFDQPQPPEVMARLQEIVSSAGLRPGEVVLYRGFWGAKLTLLDFTLSD